MLCASHEVPQQSEPISAYLRDGSRAPDPVLTKLYEKGKFSVYFKSKDTCLPNPNRELTPQERVLVAKGSASQFRISRNYKQACILIVHCGHNMIVWGPEAFVCVEKFWIYRVTTEEWLGESHVMYERKSHYAKLLKRDFFVIAFLQYKT